MALPSYSIILAVTRYIAIDRVSNPRAAPAAGRLPVPAADQHEDQGAQDDRAEDHEVRHAMSFRRVASQPAAEAAVA